MKIYKSIFTEMDFDKVYALDLREDYDIDWQILPLYENLKYLNLSGHDLSNLTEELVQFKQLETLIINNNFEEASNRFSPEHFPNLSWFENLKHLDVGGLDLGCFLEEIHQLKHLETLIINGNDYYTLEDFSINHFPNLKCLHLDIDTNEVRKTPDFCSSIPQIKELGLFINSETAEFRPSTNSGNFDHHGEVYDLPNDLGSLEQLEKLIVVFNAAPPDYEALSLNDAFQKIHALKNLQKLRTISIRNNAAAEYNTDILNDCKAISNYLPNVTVNVFDEEGNKL